MALDMGYWRSCSWINEERKRYYIAKIEQDLFGAWQLVQVWGSTRSRHGNSKEIRCDSYEDAVKRLAQTAKRRWQRGYRYADRMEQESARSP